MPLDGNDHERFGGGGSGDGGGKHGSELHEFVHKHIVTMTHEAAERNLCINCAMVEFASTVLGKHLFASLEAAREMGKLSRDSTPDEIGDFVGEMLQTYFGLIEATYTATLEFATKHGDKYDR